MRNYAEAFRLARTYKGVNRVGIFVAFGLSAVIAYSGASIYSAVFAVVFMASCMAVLKAIAGEDDYLWEVLIRRSRHREQYHDTDTLERRRRREETLVTKLPYRELSENGIIKLKNGGWLAGYSLEGIDPIDFNDEDYREVVRVLNNSFKTLDEGWCIHVQSTRSSDPSKGGEGLEWASWLSKKIGEEARGLLKQDIFKNRNTIFLTFNPINPTLKVVGPGTTDSSSDAAYFKERLARFEGIMSTAFKITRLCAKKEESGVWKDDLIREINRSMSMDGSDVYYRSDASLDTMLRVKPVFRDSDGIEGEHTCIISINGYPDESYTNALASLSRLPFETRWATRFIVFGKHNQGKVLTRCQNIWKQRLTPLVSQYLKSSVIIDPLAESKVLDLQEAKGLANKGDVLYGQSSTTIQIFAPNSKELDFRARLIAEILEREHITAIRESFNRVEAYLGSLPGNTGANVRRDVISTGNLSQLICPYSTWTGSEFHPSPLYPKQSPALLPAMTVDGLRLHVNLHSYDVGNSLILGPTGAGKTTLLAFILSEFQKYKGGKSFVFDYGGSLEPLTLGLDGSHFTLDSDQSPLNYSPFTNLDNESEGRFVKWVTDLVSFQGVSVSPKQSLEIIDAVKILSQEKAEDRSMTLLGYLLQDPLLNKAISYYCSAGALGMMLDGDGSVPPGEISTFEMEELLKREDSAIYAVLTSIFFDIESSMEGSPVLIVIDELWVFLRIERFRSMIIEWLKTVRKRNAMVVMATQHMSEIDQAGMTDIISDSCPVKVFLPNQNAEEPVIKSSYEALGLSRGMIDLIKNSQKKLDYLLVSKEGVSLFNIPFGEKFSRFLDKGRKENARIREFAATHKDGWQEKWLSGDR